MIERTALAATAALTLTLAAHPAAAGAPDTVWVKAGSSGDATVAAMDDCVVKSKSVRADFTPGYATPGVAGGVGAAIGNAIAEGIVENRAQRASIPPCMRNQGYVLLRTTAEEAAADHNARTPVQRAASLQAIYSAPDFAGRYAAATRRVAPLPLLGAETFVYHEMRIDPAALTVTPGVVQKGPVLEGDVTRRGVATLANDLHGDEFPDIAAGTPLVEIVVPGSDGQAWNYWCWHRPYLRAARQYCVRVGADGAYHLDYQPAATRYLIDAPDAGSVDGFNEVDFVLHPETKDPLPPIHIALSVRKVTESSVTLGIDATADWPTAHFWSHDVMFDANGDAVIPMWTHRLKLHHTGSGVTATLTPDGDGTPLPPDDPDA